MKFSLSGLKNAVFGTAKKITIDPINARMQKKFEAAKLLLLQDIRSHPVSQELINWTAPSAFLSGGSPNSSLFGFIGFPASYRPIDDLIEYLRTNINFVPATKISLAGLTAIGYTIPSREDFAVRFPLFWAGGTDWVFGIENGISGLGYFLNTISSYSRSTEGIQSQYPVNPGAEFRGTSFLTPLLETFNLRIR